MTTALSDILRKELAGIISLDESQFEALESHYDLLVRWNRKMNLTTVTDVREAAVRHYAESLFLATHLPESGSIVDIGSGGGFPGIPVAIARPGCALALCESHQRKAVFLREASRALANVEVMASRAEELYRQFDWMISRAVDPAALMRLRCADRFAILLGTEDAAATNAESVNPLPWGDNRVLALGGFACRNSVFGRCTSNTDPIVTEYVVPLLFGANGVSVVSRETG
jgi:16S rRNA (guanine527-N7)-methyltransferase